MNERQIDICAIICTTGNRDVLQGAVASLAVQSLAIERYEIVVVFNRNNEEKRRQLESVLSGIVNPYNVTLRIIAEPMTGLSNARNRGVAAARAKYIAFMDDDAQAERDWLENILEGFCQDERVAAVGGSIVPLWESSPPPWVRSPMYTYFSCKDFGSSARYLRVGEYFFGTNMAFTRKALIKCGGFSNSLGRKGESLLSNEEWPVFKAIDDMGLLKLASPIVKVRHIVPRSRMTYRFFIRRLWWQGVSNTVYHLKFEGRSRAWVVRHALSDFKRYYGSLLRMIRLGQSSWHLAFFNLFRWGGITHTLCNCAPRMGNDGVGPIEEIR